MKIGEAPKCTLLGTDMQAEVVENCAWPVCAAKPQAENRGHSSGTGMLQQLGDEAESSKPPRRRHDGGTSLANKKMFPGIDIFFSKSTDQARLNSLDALGKTIEQSLAVPQSHQAEPIVWICHQATTDDFMSRLPRFAPRQVRMAHLAGHSISSRRATPQSLEKEVMVIVSSYCYRCSSV